MAQISSSRQGTKNTATWSVARWLNTRSPQARLLGLICLVSLFLRLWPIGSYSTEYDEGVYWQSLRTLAEGHTLFGQIFSSQPPFFLLCLYPFYLLFGQTLVAARLAVAVYSLVGLVALYFAARAIAGRWVGVVAATLLAADPLYLQESHTLQAEVPALIFEIACVAFAVTATRHMGRQRHLLACLSGVMLGLGVMTKLFDVVALVPAALYLAQPIYLPFADDAGRLRRPTRQAIVAQARIALPDLGLFAAGALVACALVLVPFAGHLGDLYDQVVRFHVAAGHAVNRGLVYNLKMMLYVQPSGLPFGHLFGEYPLMVLALAAAALGIWRRAWQIVPPVLWAALSLALLIQQQPLFDHHRVLLSPPLALLAALAFPLAVGTLPETTTMTSRLMPKHRTPFASPGVARIVVACVVLATLASLSSSVLEVRNAAQPIPDAQRQMASALRAETLPSDQIVTDDQYIAGLAGRTVVPQLVDTSQVRIASGYLTAQQLESIIKKSGARVILFASGRFDALPGFREWVRENYSQAVDFGSGHALYLKQPNGPPIV